MKQLWAVLLEKAQYELSHGEARLKLAYPQDAARYLAELASIKSDHACPTCGTSALDRRINQALTETLYNLVDEAAAREVTT